MDERLLLAARQARDELRTVQRDLVARRNAFEQSVSRLHEAGASPEELVIALDESSESIMTIPRLGGHPN